MITIYSNTTVTKIPVNFIIYSNRAVKTMAFTKSVIDGIVDYTTKCHLNQ